MAKQTINIGAAPNDGTGTPLRTSFDYCNQNFTELYTATGPSGNNIVVPGSATITGDLTVDTSTLKVDSANNRVGIGTASPANPFDVVSASGTIALFKRTGSNSAFIGIQDGSGSLSYLGSTNGAFSIQTPGSGYSDKYTIASDGVATWSNVGGVAGTAMTLNSTGLAIGGSAFSISRLTLVSSASNDCLFSLQKSGTARTAVVKTDGTNLYLSSDSGATGNKISLSLTAPDSSLSIDSSGNVGVGVTPSAWLSALTALQVKGVSGVYGAGSSEFGSVQNCFYNASSQWVYGTTAASGKYAISSGVHQWFNAPSGTAGNAITFTQAMTLDASGRLLVGKTATSATTVGVELQPDGNVWATKAGSTAATTAWDTYSTGAAAYRFYVSMNGTVNATNTVISAISDVRLKENIQDIDVGLAAILSLKPRKFDWKAGKGKDIKGDRGFIAQEFETVFPNLVDEWKDPAPEGEAPYKSVRQDLIPVLVKAIQELTARVQTLEAR